MHGRRVSFTAELWEHEGTASWFFLSLPDEVADEIDERWGQHAGGFGSVRVEVTVGTTTWRTSLFPDTKRGTYLLPVKKAVRTAEDLADGSVVAVELVVIQDGLEPSARLRSRPAESGGVGSRPAPPRGGRRR